MNFRTALPIGKELVLDHTDRFFSMGSCFADYFGKRLQYAGFQVVSNPFGVLYNPMSIVKAMERLRCGLAFTADDLCCYNGRYFSFAHHGSFSGDDQRVVLNQIDASFKQSVQALEQATCLLLTFGTSWVYALAETGKIVANCHKLPDDMFVRRRLDVGEIVDYYSEFFDTLLSERPQLKVVVTISPIRHLKDGLHENTLSKSVLHLAVDELCMRFEQLHYFPAYELLMDDLRDYRFYADDMLHPSPMAQHYCWERFAEFAFDQPTLSIAAQVESLHKSMEHKPLHPEEEAYQTFLKKTLAQLEWLQSRYPQLSLHDERQRLESLMRD